MRDVFLAGYVPHPALRATLSQGERVETCWLQNTEDPAFALNALQLTELGCPCTRLPRERTQAGNRNKSIGFVIGRRSGTSRSHWRRIEVPQSFVQRLPCSDLVQTTRREFAKQCRVDLDASGSANLLERP